VSESLISRLFSGPNECRFESIDERRGRRAVWSSRQRRQRIHRLSRYPCHTIERYFYSATSGAPIPVSSERRHL